jgi:hypothetical protein
MERNRPRWWSITDAAGAEARLPLRGVVGSGGAFGTVIVANTDRNVITTELAVGEFVGDCSVPPARDGPGRNGVIVIEEGLTAMSGGDGTLSNFTRLCCAAITTLRNLL